MNWPQQRWWSNEKLSTQMFPPSATTNKCITISIKNANIKQELKWIMNEGGGDGDVVIIFIFENFMQIAKLLFNRWKKSSWANGLSGWGDKQPVNSIRCLTILMGMYSGSQQSLITLVALVLQIKGILILGNRASSCERLRRKPSNILENLSKRIIHLTTFLVKTIEKLMRCYHRMGITITSGLFDFWQLTGRCFIVLFLKIEVTSVRLTQRFQNNHEIVRARNCDHGC